MSVRELQDAMREFVDSRATHKASNAVLPLSADLQRLQKEHERLVALMNGADGIITRLALGDRRMAEIENDVRSVSRQCDQMLTGLQQIKESMPPKDGFWDKKTVHIVLLVLAALLGGGLGGAGSSAIEGPGAAEIARELAKQLQQP